MARTLKGKTYTWQLGEQPIGSGDAGEVYAVQCLEQPSMKGMMKKPARIATGGTIQRQAGQIAQESLALARLEGLPRCKAHPPRLLDEAPAFTQGTANYFMVSERAPGEDMASMLIESRQKDKPFPRRVIISVLDALFDLFARAHRAGVLWNDVKLDHIYWHNPTGDVAVIDWGNAQFLDGDEKDARRTLPRWEDYQQLVDTLGGFLKQNAPELYTDLGWSEFQGKDLDLVQVSVLARRIAYQQQVIGLRVMEYQALVRVILSEDPSLAGLEKIRDYQRSLDQIGAPWETPAILDYAKSLVINALADHEINPAIRGTAILWDIFGNHLDLSWYLLREYFRIPDLISQAKLDELVESTLNQNWSKALWVLTTIAREMQSSDWWEDFIPVLRQQALDEAIPRPHQSALALLTWAQSGENVYQNLQKDLKKVVHNWRVKGESTGESPFDYFLMDLPHNETTMPQKLRSQIKMVFAVGQKPIRELFKNWQVMDLEKIPETLQLILVWDPDRWGILDLSKTIDKFQSWLDKLYVGPAQGSDFPAFIQKIIADRPQVERQLGNPPWLRALIHALDAIKQGEPISSAAEVIEQFCPWLLPYETIHKTRQKSEADETAIKETLTHFSKHLKHWSALESALNKVAGETPQFHPACKNLIEGYQTIANLNANKVKIAAFCQVPPHSALEESCQGLNLLISWREAITENHLQKAQEILKEAGFHDWEIIAHAQEVTAEWNEIINPILKAIYERTIPPGFGKQPKKQQILLTIADGCSNILTQWNKLYETGFNADLLEILRENADSNRSEFLEWRRTYEYPSDRMQGLLYHSNLGLIRSISANLLRLSQHSRQAFLSFIEIQKGQNISRPSLLRACDSLLSHLGKIEEVLIKKPEDQRFPDWIAQFQQIYSAKTPIETRELVLTLDESHPLYAWLVQSLLAE